MKKIRELITKVNSDEKARKEIFLITLITALFVLAIVIKGPEAQGRFITDKTGNVIGIERKSLKTAEQYNLNLSIINGDRVSERSVQINKQAVTDNTSGKPSVGVNQEAEREAEITGIITDIELSTDRKITLPASLSDGSSLKWSINTNADNNSFLFAPLVYLCLIALAVKSSIDSNKDAGKEFRQSIIRGLPRFTNQLLLMMNAGMILSDAVDRICSSYAIFGEEGMGVFETELIKLSERNKDHRSSTAKLINEFAAKHNVKELMRISTILTENERRGSDVIDNLERESKYLWDDRKIIAREKGKNIDTKMSGPLAVLLILLIVITMAPALLNL